MKMTGRVFINIAGIGRVSSLPGATINIGSEVATPVMSDVGVSGFSYSQEAPFVEFNVRHGAHVNVTALSQVRESTIVYETDTGRVFTLHGATCGKALEVSSGVIQCKFFGDLCTEH